MSAEGRSRAVAAVIVLVIHGTVAWVLLRAPVRHADGSADRPVLRVRWIEIAPPVPQPTLPPARATPPPLHHRPLSSGRQLPLQTTAEPAPEATVSPHASDYVAQGAAWAAETAPAVDFRPGLTASRTPTLPGGANGGRFHMREPPSPQKTLLAIGKLLAGPDYTTDPCPRMHENVYGLLPDTSDEGRQRLAWELREYRERCRP